MGNTEEFRCISLCTGYAGLELGLRRVIANLRTIAYVEVEAFACANLVAKIEAGLLDAAPVWTDIKTFDAEPFRDRVHIITAGYPCQGESVAGKQLGKADSRWLWPHIERIIKAVRPVWFFGENVAGHLALGFPEVYRSLRDMGYKVEAGLFSAAECGAPHRRERLFILAYCECTESRQRTFKKTQTGIGGDRPAIGSMADTECAQGTFNGRHQGIRGMSQQITKWPSRPGQPQYKWEKPRVVGNSRQLTKRMQKKHKNQTKRKTRNRRNSNTNNSVLSTKSGNEQAQSRLGGAVDGPSCRVDRLRLLGNGVVPQQAEKAFRELIGLFE